MVNPSIRGLLRPPPNEDASPHAGAALDSVVYRHMCQFLTAPVIPFI